MWSGDFFVRQSAGVDPLDKVFEVDGAGGGEVEGRGARFAEVVRGVESGGEEGRDGAEDFAVYEERSFLFADGDGEDGLKERACWRRGAAREGTREGVLLGCGNLLDSAALVLSSCWHHRKCSNCRMTGGGRRYAVI